jgi:Domain of unknown function (DU1801)
MAELKTKENDASVQAFLNKVDNEQKRRDCEELVRMMADVSKLPAKMWGTAIIGFDSYHYKYDSGHEGDMCMIGFSPRKANIALYISGGGLETHAGKLKKLGKHKTGKGCLYINKLEDVDAAVLKSIMKDSLAFMRNKYKK